MTKLTQEETARLCLLVQQYPNALEGKQALDTLVKGHIGLVHFVKKMMPTPSTHLKTEDLIQEGIIGLIIAIRKYDPSVAMFSTYANKWIRQSIQRAIHGQSHTIGIPDRLQGYKTSDISRLPRAVFGDYTPDFLDALVYNSNMPKSDIYPEEIIVNGHTIEDAHALLGTLTPKQRDVILRSFGLFSGEEETLQSIADSYECSKQCIWEMREKAIVKLRQINPNVFVDVKLEHYKPTKNVLTVTEAKKIVAMRETMSFRDMAQELGLASVGGASHKYTAAKKILEQHPQ